jgi:hypothetical protein
MQIAARRDAEADSYYWRVTQFLMPIYTMIPAPPGDPISFTGAVPTDDENMIGFTVTWHADRPLNQREIEEIESWTGVHTEVDPKRSSRSATRTTSICWIATCSAAARHTPAFAGFAKRTWPCRRAWVRFSIAVSNTWAVPTWR